jgi:hypothetical protein
MHPIIEFLLYLELLRNRHVVGRVATGRLAWIRGELALWWIYVKYGNKD